MANFNPRKIFEESLIINIKDIAQKSENKLANILSRNRSTKQKILNILKSNNKFDAERKIEI